jgi:hypothetical protein
MRFDIILGNPPYNDTQDSLSKKNNRKGMVAGLYKLFISHSRKWIKEDGRLMFILPAGGFKSLLKSGYKINKSRYNPLNSWNGVNVCTANWYCSLKDSGLYDFTYNVMDKILKQDYSKMNQNVRAKDGGIFPYNFYSHAITREELEVLENKNPYTSGTFRLKSTEQNKRNVNILMDYLKPYISQYSFSMYSLTKKLKVEWLEGFDRDITKEDIIEYYQLTKEEINVF